jgi:hypothetical protein
MSSEAHESDTRLDTRLQSNLEAVASCWDNIKFMAPSAPDLNSSEGKSGYRSAAKQATA